MKRLTVLFLTFLMTGLAFGTDYYISSQANFNTYRDATFSPGDNILFERGQVFTGMFYPNVLGTPGNVITISAYGSGDLPVINNNGVIHANGVSAGLYLLNTGYVEVSNLEITNNNGGNQAENLFGILVRADDIGVLH